MDYKVNIKAKVEHCPRCSRFTIEVNDYGDKDYEVIGWKCSNCFLTSFDYEQEE